jgi:hypothetical protein
LSDHSRRDSTIFSPVRQSNRSGNINYAQTYFKFELLRLLWVLIGAPIVTLLGFLTFFLTHSLLAVVLVPAVLGGFLIYSFEKQKENRRRGPIVVEKPRPTKPPTVYKRPWGPMGNGVTGERYWVEACGGWIRKADMPDGFLESLTQTPEEATR